jgi:sec-independent protein translocase protein TatA
MGEFSLTHWLIILVILVIFFGPSRLPQLGQSLGKALRGFKEGLSDKDKEKEVQGNDPMQRIQDAKTTETEVSRQATETTKKS